MRFLAFIALFLSFNTASLAQFSEEEKDFFDYMETICNSAHFECIFDQKRSEHLQTLRFRVRQGSDSSVLRVTVDDHTEAVRFLESQGFKFASSYQKYVPPTGDIERLKSEISTTRIDPRSGFSFMSAPAETSAMMRERRSDARTLQVLCLATGGACDVAASKIALKTLPAMAATFICTGAAASCVGKLEEYIKDLDKDIEVAEGREKIAAAVRPVKPPAPTPKPGGGGTQVRDRRAKPKPSAPPILWNLGNGGVVRDPALRKTRVDIIDR